MTLYSNIRMQLQARNTYEQGPTTLLFDAILVDSRLIPSLPRGGISSCEGDNERECEDARSGDKQGIRNDHDERENETLEVIIRRKTKTKIGENNHENGDNNENKQNNKNYFNEVLLWTMNRSASSDTLKYFPNITVRLMING